MGRWGTWGACGCCSTDITVTYTIRGEGGTAGPLLPGATVTFTSGGTTVATGTTNSNGVVTLTVPSGTYTRTISACLHQTATATVTIAATVTATLSVSALATVHITDTIGSHAATFGTAPSGSNYTGQKAWITCYTFSSTNCATVSSTFGCACSAGQAGTVAVRHVVTYAATPDGTKSESSWLYTSGGTCHGLTPSTCSSNNLVVSAAGGVNCGPYLVGIVARVMAEAPKSSACSPLNVVYTPNYLNTPPNGSNQGTDQPITGDIAMVP